MVTVFRLALLGLLLTGCARGLPPEARCFAAATEDFRAARRVYLEAQENLARGYAIHRQTLAGMRHIDCTGNGDSLRCRSRSREILETPVPIDRSAEIARRDRARARMDALRPAATARAAPCGFGAWLAEHREPR